MIRKEAIVISITEDMAWVETRPESACGTCESRGGCADRVIQKPFQAKVFNPLDARVGDRVMLAVDSGSLLLGSLLVYIAPLLLMLVFALISNSIMDALGIVSPVPTIIVTLAGLFCGLWIVRQINKNLKSDPRFCPQIDEIISG